MHVTDLAINKIMGMRFAAPEDSHILEMPESPLQHKRDALAVDAGAEWETNFPEGTRER